MLPTEKYPSKKHQRRYFFIPKNGIKTIISHRKDADILSTGKTIVDIWLEIWCKKLTTCLSTWSGTLRAAGQSLRAAECEKRTGAREVARASFIVCVDACDRSTIIPSRFISSTTFCTIFKFRVDRKSHLCPERVKHRTFLSPNLNWGV